MVVATPLEHATEHWRPVGRTTTGAPSLLASVDSGMPPSPEFRVPGDPWGVPESLPPPVGAAVPLSTTNVLSACRPLHASTPAAPHSNAPPNRTDPSRVIRSMPPPF